MAKQFRDSDGKVPQHTWFYPPHHQEAFLEDLVTLCKKGFGEIEMHMHHNRMNPFPEINDSFRVKLLKCVEDYSKYGIFCLPDGSKKFGFIHGDWSLDNARGEKFCGVNNEIQLLKECGCYADFTFPTIEIAQPRMINKMYYANDNPLKSKSYDVGNEIVVHGEVSGDLMIVQGILGLRWGSKRFFLKPTIETSNLDFNEEPTIARTDFWVKNAIVVKGRPQWRFIKLHTHGAREETWDSLFGSSAESMFNHLSQVYNDKERYSLHYVTAREMYNIVKAAEAGKEGNPNQFRDFIIPRYIYLEK
ncbi:MAG TPA: hypothetical protein PLF03_03850 [Candidatus Omnitrophota bacterium]|nr:hypothetical protein [Candidatus Omnitrophota bacterium]